MHIKKGDTVKIIAGKDKGNSGKVLMKIPKREMVVVEGVNMVKRHHRSRQRGQSGQIVERPMPVHISNVQKIKK